MVLGVFRRRGEVLVDEFISRLDVIPPDSILAEFNSWLSENAKRVKGHTLEYLMARLADHSYLGQACTAWTLLDFSLRPDKEGLDLDLYKILYSVVSLRLVDEQEGVEANLLDSLLYGSKLAAVGYTGSLLNTLLAARDKIETVMAPELYPMRYGFSLVRELRAKKVPSYYLPDEYAYTLISRSTVVLAAFYGLTPEGDPVSDPGANSLLKTAKEMGKTTILVQVPGAICMPSSESIPPEEHLAEYTPKGQDKEPVQVSLYSRVDLDSVDMIVLAGTVDREPTREGLLKRTEELRFMIRKVIAEL